MDTLKQDGVIFVNTDDDMQTVLNCFKNNKISHVPVMNETKLVGMISKTDVVEYLCDHDEDFGSQSYSEILQTVKAKQMMVQPLVVAKTTDSERTLLETLVDHKVSSVILKDENDKLAGIVTDKDMLAYLFKNTDEELSFGERMGLEMAQWLNDNGVVRISKALSDIGI